MAFGGFAVYKHDVDRFRVKYKSSEILYIWAMRMTVML